MNENSYGHIMETPQKVIRVEVESDTKIVDGKLNRESKAIRHQFNWIAMSEEHIPTQYLSLYLSQRNNTNQNKKKANYIFMSTVYILRSLHCDLHGLKYPDFSSHMWKNNFWRWMYCSPFRHIRAATNCPGNTQLISWMVSEMMGCTTFLAGGPCFISEALAYLGHDGPVVVSMAMIFFAAFGS